MKTAQLELVQMQFKKDAGSCCLSCGWSPAFMELEETLEEESPGVFYSPCVNGYADDASSHRGHYIYLPEESK